MTNTKYFSRKTNRPTVISKLVDCLSVTHVLWLNCTSYSVDTSTVG